MTATFRVFSHFNHQLVKYLTCIGIPILVDDRTGEEKNNWLRKNAQFGHVFTGGYFTKWDDEIEFVDAYVQENETIVDFQKLARMIAVRENDPDVIEPFKVESQVLSLEDEEIVVVKKYDFRTWYDESHDTMFYEVTKAYTDLPFTSVVYNHSNKGHRKFFASLFTQTSWGICPEDMDFLHQVWLHLEMPGEYDIEEIVKAQIKLCEAGEIEPQVYRRSIEEVQETFEKRKFIGVKRKAINQEPQSFEIPL